MWNSTSANRNSEPPAYDRRTSVAAYGRAGQSSEDKDGTAGNDVDGRGFWESTGNQPQDADDVFAQSGRRFAFPFGDDAGSSAQPTAAGTTRSLRRPRMDSDVTNDDARGASDGGGEYPSLQQGAGGAPDVRIAPVVPVLFSMGVLLFSLCCLATAIMDWDGDDLYTHHTRTDDVVRCGFAVLLAVVPPVVWRGSPEVWASSAMVAFICNSFSVSDSAGGSGKADYFFYVYAGATPCALLALVGATLCLMQHARPGPAPPAVSVNAAAARRGAILHFGLERCPGFNALFAAGVVLLAVGRASYFANLIAQGDVHRLRAAAAWASNWPRTIAFALHAAATVLAALGFALSNRLLTRKTQRWGGALAWFAFGGATPPRPNATLFLGANNVAGAVAQPAVLLLGSAVRSLAACEELCFHASTNTTCLSFTWHHMDYSKPQYRGHCYGRIDPVWKPIPESGIDSGCRTDTGNASRCRAPVGPSPTPPPTPRVFQCRTSLDCSGGNGVCTPQTGRCRCHPGWAGSSCGSLNFAPGGSARMAYSSELWTWGASAIVDESTGVHHLFSSQISNQCGIQHYCLNSEVVHLTSPNSSGPFEFVSIALAPREGKWDDGAIHGITAHKLPNGTYALFYMGSEMANLTARPNCSAGSGDSAANRTTGSHHGRRIGIATAASLDGPWQRLDAPIFGPDPAAWDHSDVSNPCPIIKADGSVVMIYKGNGKTQHMGLAFASSVDGPFTRNGSDPQLVPWPQLVGEDPAGWIDATSGIYHVIFKNCDNTNLGTGLHCWSHDGRVWHPRGCAPLSEGEFAYTGHVTWAADGDTVHRGKSTVLARRERPQLMLGNASGSSYGTVAGGVLFAAAEDCNSFVPGVADAGSGVPCTTWDPDAVGTTKSFTMLQHVASAKNDHGGSLVDVGG